MTTQANSYQDFARRREQLAAALETLAEAFRKLGANERADSLLKSRGTLLKDTFKVMMVGEFKTGKSTLINALLGESLLPTKIAPCTGAITRIRYDERKRVVLAYKDKRPPLVVSLEAAADELKKHITIKLDDDPQDEGKDEVRTTQAVDNSPYSMAYVFYPLALCRNNVEIVDSPGLNEHKTRTAITKAFFAEADAMVMVLSCEKLFSATEKHFVDVDLEGRDLRDVFFLCNRFDACQGSSEEAADIGKLARNALEPRAGTGARIFFVSAKDALMGRKNNQAPLLARSNIPQFEAALELFLSTERGRVKLRNPMRQAESAIREGMLELIPHRENLLRQPLEEVQRKLEQQRPQLEAAEKHKEQLLRSVDRRGEALSREVEASYRTLTAELESGLRRQAQLINLSTWQTIAKRSDAKSDIAKQLEEWTNKQVKKWKQDKLEPLVESHLKELEVDLDDRAREFLANLDKVKAAFAPEIKAKGAVTAAPNVSPISRLVLK